VRIRSVVFTALLSLIILPAAAWAKPPIIITHITSQCVNGAPTITVTLDPVSWGAWNGFIYYHLNPPSAGIPFPNTNPATLNVPSTPNPGSLQITSVSTPTGGTPSAISPYTVASCGPATVKKGMTWSHTLSNAQTGTITVGCGPTGPNQCNAYQGDTVCTLPRPLLCIYKPAPAFPVPAGVNNADQYNKWAGGVVATTQPVAGSSFAHLADADKYCVTQFGPGWRVAEFHDGWGWHFQAYGGTVSAPTIPSTRFWVQINNQPANCWATP
jgi:hypothetical protein